MLQRDRIVERQRFTMTALKFLCAAAQAVAIA